MHSDDVHDDEITWINHAGFQLWTNGIRLVCDPWLTGSAFDRGWDLLVPAHFSVEDLSRATHIWLSHEHPDHFSPGDIRQIDPARRSQITVLFQRTRDRRVAAFCVELGFRVQELDEGVPFDLAPGVRGVIGVVGADSWLHIETPSFTYLNVNDCILSHDRHMAQVRRALARPLDVLFTQFSYANWAGNRGDTHAMRVQAIDKIKEMHRLVAHLRPRFLVPFASFVFFSNEENFYLNEGANTVDTVFDLFDLPDRPCVVLYPGDVWSPGHPHDSRPRLARYASARAQIKPLHEPRPISLDALQQLAVRCAERLAVRNHLQFVKLMEWGGLIEPLIIHLGDLGVTIAYRPGRKLDVVTAAVPHVVCSSDAFSQSLRSDYGVDTLLVNGRFQVARPDGQARLSRAFAINRYNAQGIAFPWGVLAARLRDMGAHRARGQVG